MQLKRLFYQLKRDEGLRLKPYKCSMGKTTIGFGRNLEANGITSTEAEILLSFDVHSVIESIERNFDFYDDLSDVRKEVIVNMVFQMGMGTFMKFKKTIKYLENKEYQRASIEMLDSSWYKQTPKRAERASYAMKNNKFMKGGK